METSYLPLKKYKEVIRNAPIVCVDLVLRNNKGQILLVKRNHEPLKGEWFIPGGRIRKGETAAQALRRKARQELGIDEDSLMILGICGSYEDLECARYGMPFHCVSLVFEGHYVGKMGKIKLNGDASAWKWGKKIPERIRLL